MAIKGSDPILGPARGSPVKFLDVFMQPDQKDRDYVMGVSKFARLAGVDDAIVFAQFCMEATEPSVQPLSPGTSVRWNRDLNPAGIGIPLDTTNQPVTINDGDEAARIHIQCLYSLAKRVTHPGVPIPSQWVEWFTHVWLPKVCDLRAPTVTTLADLNIRYTGSDGQLRATWAWDAGYLDGMLGYAAKWLYYVADYQKEQAPMGYQPVTVFRDSMLPVGFPTRSGGKLDTTRGPLHVTVHETANTNPGMTARVHAETWQHGSNAIAHDVSVHLYVGDEGIFQCLPLDEVGWHAGDGCDNLDTDVGCFRSVAIEKEVNSDSDWEKANTNLAICMSMIAAGDPAFDWGGGSTKGKFDTDHYDQHTWVSQEVPPHDCPYTIRHAVNSPWDWTYLMAQVDYWKPQVDAYLKGTTVPNVPPKPKPTVYAKPTPIAAASANVLPFERAMTTVRPVTPRVSASRWSQPTGPDLPVGKAVILQWMVWSHKEQTFWLVDHTGVRYAPIAFFV